MKREDLKIGQMVKLPAKDIVTWEGEVGNLTPNIHHQNEKIMYVRELYNPLCAGLSYKKTGKKHIYGILYGVIQPCKPL